MSTHSFDKDYWEQHWEVADTPIVAASAANPHLVRELAGLAPGSALDAGCGTGAEALWLAGQGWQVTGADISAAALARARQLAAGVDRVTWVEADLTTWEPGAEFDLVVTNYAHPAIPQLAFYTRLATWVAPGGTLLIVGHLHQAGEPGHGGGHGHGEAHGQSEAHGHGEAPGTAPQHSEEPPAEATVTLADITALLDPGVWRINTAEEQTRERPGGQGLPLHDVIVRAARLG